MVEDEEDRKRVWTKSSSAFIESMIKPLEQGGVEYGWDDRGTDPIGGVEMVE